MTGGRDPSDLHRREFDAGNIPSHCESATPCARDRDRHGDTVSARTYVNGAGAAGAMPANAARRTD